MVGFGIVRLRFEILVYFNFLGFMFFMILGLRGLGLISKV